MNETTVLDEMFRLDPEALARVWVDLNRWAWPRDLPGNLKPRWWDGDGPIPSKRTIADRRHGYSGPLMEYVEAHVSEDAIHAAWQDATEAPHDTD